MALINCPECSHQVSDSALNCVQCGFQLRKTKKSTFNKVLRVSLSGGIIGWMTTNPRKALDNAISSANKEGWTATHIDNHSNSNLLIRVIQLVVLLLTFFLWTWSDGYLVLLEKEVIEEV